MSFNYVEVRSMVSTLIANFGFVVTVEKPSGATFKTRAVFDTQTKQDAPPSTTEDAESLLVAHTKGTPEVGDYLRTKDAVLMVKSVSVIAPGNVPIAYQVEVA